MIQHVREQRHKHIGAGQTTDVLDELSHQHNGHIGGKQSADGAADGIEDEARGGHVPLAESLCQRPHGENTDAHGDTADDGDHGLGNAVIVGTQNVIAEIDQTDILDGAARGVNQEIGVDQQHVFIRKNGFQLGGKGNPGFSGALHLLRDPLFCEIILQQRQGQGENGENAHQRDPLSLVHADDRHDDHGEHQRHQNAAHHDSGNLVVDGQAAPLLGVPGGQGHHQVVAHVENGVGKRVEKVIAHHNPDGLHGLRTIGHREQQDTGNGHQRRGKQQPGASLALGRMGTVDDIAHNDVGDGIHDFGHNGEHHQKRPAPEGGQLQNIRIVDV